MCSNRAKFTFFASGHPVDGAGTIMFSCCPFIYACVRTRVLMCGRISNRLIVDF